MSLCLPGVAAVLSGKTRASGGVAEEGKGEASLSGHEESNLVSRGRAVFKPVINRIDSLELQVHCRVAVKVIFYYY